MRADEPLADRRIGVPESRQLDLFAQMLERRGADVVRCPLVAIHDTPESAPVERWIDDVLAHGLDDMIWLTGEGVRRIDGFLERGTADRRHRFWDRLASTRSVTRGPKPVRELKPRGIPPGLAATTPTTDGVIEALSDVDLRGHRVGVQLYGRDPNTRLMDALAAAGATALPVAPYVYADAADETRVVDFITQIIDGQLAAIAFTSSPQIVRLFQIARRHECESALAEAMRRLCIAAVGPLVADTLVEHGQTADLMPDHNYFMKPLVRALSAHFGDVPAA